MYIYVYMEKMLNYKISLNVQTPLKLWLGWQDEIFESYCEGFLGLFLFVCLGFLFVGVFLIETVTLKFSILKESSNSKGAFYLTSAGYLQSPIVFGWGNNSRLPFSF